MVYNDTINCGTNPSFSKDPSPSDCLARGLPTEPKGRRRCDDPGILKKRFFGSITLSQGFFEWATKGLDDGFQELIVRKQKGEERKARAHDIKCGGDAMFHAGKGMVGLKVDFALNVTIENAIITDIENLADTGSFLCRNGVTFYPDKGTLKPGFEGYGGADVYGVIITKAYNVLLSNITLDSLYSLKGRAVGVDLIGQETGVALIEPNPEVDASKVRIKNVEVGSNITAGQKGYAVPINTDAHAVNMGNSGFSSEKAANIEVSIIWNKSFRHQLGPDLSDGHCLL